MYIFIALTTSAATMATTPLSKVLGLDRELRKLLYGYTEENKNIF